MPRAGFIVVEAELVLGSLKTVLNRPAMTLDKDKFFQGRALRTPSREEGHLPIGNIAADQQPTRPFARESVFVVTAIEIGQPQIGPIVPARSLGSFPCRQALPGTFR